MRIASLELVGSLLLAVRHSSMTILCQLKDGEFKIKNENLFRYIKQNFKDGDYSVNIKPRRKIRSLSQNALYWVWLDIISGDLGYDSEELHATFRSMFLTDKTKKVPLIRSTTALSTSEFTIYLDKIERFCNQELNIFLPHPEDLINGEVII
jgi:hypothetical protein